MCVAIEHLHERGVVPGFASGVDGFEREVLGAPAIRVAASWALASPASSRARVGRRVGTDAVERGLASAALTSRRQSELSAWRRSASAAWTRTSVSSSCSARRRRLERAFRGTPATGLALGGAEFGEELPLVGAGRRSGCCGDQVEGLLIPADGIIGRERVARGVSGTADVVERLVDVGGAGGGDPVVGEFGERRRVLDDGSCFEGFGDALVGALTAGRAQFVVEASVG